MGETEKQWIYFGSEHSRTYGKCASVCITFCFSSLHSADKFRFMLLVILSIVLNKRKFLSLLFFSYYKIIYDSRSIQSWSITHVLHTCTYYYYMAIICLFYVFSVNKTLSSPYALKHHALIGCIRIAYHFTWIWS